MNKIIICISLFGFFISGTAVADTESVPVQWFADGSESGGWSHLTRTESAVFITVEAAGLAPGDAVTLWWVVFNDPAGCGNACGDDEFEPDGPGFGPAQVAVGNATGNVVKSDGTLEFGGKLRMGVNEPGHQVVFNAGGDGAALLTVDPAAAEIHVVVQSHGQGRGGKKLREQLSLLEANCTPACADVQFAVHQP